MYALVQDYVFTVMYLRMPGMDSGVLYLARFGSVWHRNAVQQVDGRTCRCKCSTVPDTVCNTSVIDCQESRAFESFHFIIESTHHPMLASFTFTSLVALRFLFLFNKSATNQPLPAPPFRRKG